MSLWNSKQSLALSILIILLTILVYLPALKADFIWDDDEFLTENRLIHAPDGLARFWLTTQAPDYFPLVSSMLWVEWRLWGMNATGYHVVNILLHGLGALLLWRVLAELKIPGAFWAGLIFAVHPVNVESVAWITERKNTLPMVFYLLTILAYLRFRATADKRYYYGALLAFLLALLGKTSVVMLPMVLLGCLWWQTGRITRKDILQSLPFFGLAVLFGLITVWFQYHRAIGEDVVRTDGFLSRLIIAGWAVWFYLYKALVPVNLSFVYPRWSADPASVFSYLPGVLVIGLLVVFWHFRHRLGRSLFLAFAYFVLTLLPILGFLNIYFMRYSLVADHWQHISMISVVALVVGLLFAAFANQQGTIRYTPHLVAFCVVAVLSVLTWKQASIYKNQQTLWTDTLAKNPTCWLGHDQLGIALAKQDKLDEAIPHFYESLRINPNDDWGYYNLGLSMALKNKHQEAAEFFNKALRISPNRVLFRYHLGLSLMAMGDFAGAVAEYQSVLKINPREAATRVALGNAMASLGQLDQAIEQYEKALELQPNLTEAQSNLDVIMSAKKKNTEEISFYNTTLQVKPKDAMAHHRLAMAYENIGQRVEAMKHYRQAIEYNPQGAEAMVRLAWLLATHSDDKLRNGSEALRLVRRAKELSALPSPELLDALAAAYAETGDFAQAQAVARQAVEQAEMAGKKNMAQQIQTRLAAYQAHRPWRR